ncbi:hypothetical protein N7532_012066 [Penicillium argentinense]|uniref:Aminoglycoside phosphotransferase domain-containing protein n=1 Tax=Penicillium argentinense TaxID=1131581 RepID=A0A9W9JVE8_9EURO|nr:uncharacterized protein N7532_012066 [Penicillium argentinense]KAJ5083023.1 hypothetical protein N7532_012066 [Penicillium argentinense]
MAELLGLLAEASRLHSGMKCWLVQERAHRGSSHDVFRIEFSDSTQWAMRVCRGPHDWPAELRAVKTLDQIKHRHPRIRAPQVHGTKHPVWFMEWIEGSPMESWSRELSQRARQGFLDDMADFLLQLWSTPAPVPTYPTPVTPYSAWLTDSIDRGLRRTLSGDARWGDAMDYLIMRSMVAYYSIAVDEYTQIGIAHGDLSTHNIMVDSSLRVTGVIDWDWLYLAPLPAVIHHPWFIADVPGWKKDWNHDGQTFEWDREYLELAEKQLQIVLSKHPRYADLTGVQRIRQMLKEG